MTGDNPLTDRMRSCKWFCTAIFVFSDHFLVGADDSKGGLEAAVKSYYDSFKFLPSAVSPVLLLLTSASSPVSPPLFKSPYHYPASSFYHIAIM